MELGSDQDDDDDNDADSEDGSEGLAGWMVGDDEVEFEDGAEIKIDSKAATAMEVDVYTEVGKAGSKSTGQRFSRLVQTTLGPFWEDTLAEVKQKGQSQYTIHLLNGKTFIHSLGHPRPAYMLIT